MSKEKMYTARGNHYNHYERGVIIMIIMSKDENDEQMNTARGNHYNHYEQGKDEYGEG